MDFTSKFTSPASFNQNLTELGPRPHRRRAAGAASSLRAGTEHGLAGALDDAALLSPTSLSRLLGRLEGTSSDTGLSDPSHL